MKVRSWDKVIIIAGKQKWEVWEILKVFKKENRVLVKWINIVKRHLKKMWTTPGRILDMEKPIDSSNVLLECPFTKKPTRIWFVFIEEKWDRKKFRYSKKAVKELSKDPKEVIIK